MGVKKAGLPRKAGNLQVLTILIRKEYLQILIWNTDSGGRKESHENSTRV